MPLWANRTLAVVHACGSPDTTRSHFDAQDYMESGTPGVKSTDGRLARPRAVGARPAKPSPFRAVAIGPALPRTLAGRHRRDLDAVPRPASTSGPEPTGRRAPGFESLYEQGVRDLLHGTGRETFDAVSMLKSAGASRLAPANGAEYPRGRFGAALRQIAQLIKADVGLEVAFADMQGWDTHVGQGAERGQLALRLARLRRGARRVRPGPRRQDGGRRRAHDVGVRPDRRARTATAAPTTATRRRCSSWAAACAAAGSTGGGRDSAADQLFEGRDLAVTTDFRGLFAEVAAHHLGIPTAPIFPGFKPTQPPLGILA